MIALFYIIIQLLSFILIAIGILIFVQTLEKKNTFSLVVGIASLTLTFLIAVYFMFRADKIVDLIPK